MRAVTALLLVFLAAPVAVEAQSAQSVQRVGLLLSGRSSEAGTDRLQAAFVGALRERGWTEGQNLALERRYAEGRHEQFPDLAAELVRLKVDVLVAWVTAAARAAQNATKTIPIVTLYVGDPVQLGFAKTLGRPGGNITGLTFVPSFEVYAKQVALLNEVAPTASSIGVLWNPRNPAHSLMVQETQAGARALGLKVRALPVHAPEEIDAAFAEVARERPAAALVVADAMFGVHRARLVKLAAEHRLPTIYGSREYVEAGGLLSYGPDQIEQARRAAYYVDRILRGANPAELPMEQPTRLELAINAKTANALGLKIPPALLVRADYIIK
jgi:putative ABC transport system substrate-binding protein